MRIAERRASSKTMQLLTAHTKKIVEHVQRMLYTFQVDYIKCWWNDGIVRHVTDGRGAYSAIPALQKNKSGWTIIDNFIFLFVSIAYVLV